MAEARRDSQRQTVADPALRCGKVSAHDDGVAIRARRGVRPMGAARPTTLHARDGGASSFMCTSYPALLRSCPPAPAPPSPYLTNRGPVQQRTPPALSPLPETGRRDLAKRGQHSCSDAARGSRVARLVTGVVGWLGCAQGERQRFIEGSASLYAATGPSDTVTHGRLQAPPAHWASSWTAAPGASLKPHHQAACQCPRRPPQDDSAPSHWHHKRAACTQCTCTCTCPGARPAARSELPLAPDLARTGAAADSGKLSRPLPAGRGPREHRACAHAPGPGQASSSPFPNP
ncbi:hypothetical protein BC834DRAFT_902897 [Gloeopeniophorella convolvens]|nr:hypothetical protein BC834DRAFT_902897 [Gloeopeniophorella convolvens]